jgi:DNA polymerase V
MSSTKHDHWFLLVDCNQFFVSCEQAFNPRLLKKAVVVLSNNDGCVVARSQEAKDIGIPMGVPLFKVQDTIKKYNVNVLSSNYELYGDMSMRVMQMLRQFSPDIEEYSIDEAFLKIDEDNPVDVAKKVKFIVQKNTGIPVSIGIGRTKTLAKMASDIAKKQKAGVYKMDQDMDETLKKMPVIDIWGVGKNLAAQLKSHQIYTAFDLKSSDDSFIRSKFSIVLFRTVLELRGINCLNFKDTPHHKKSITSSKSFGKLITHIQELEEALSSYVAIAVAKLRREESKVRTLCVFLTTSRFKEDFYYNYQLINLPKSSDYTPEIISYAKTALKKIFIEGYAYKKVGITLLDLSPKNAVATDFFDSYKEVDEKRTKVMNVIDSITEKIGKNSIYFAAQGIQKEWISKKELRSSRYTTKWDEILTIKI